MCRGTPEVIKMRPGRSRGNGGKGIDARVTGRGVLLAMLPVLGAVQALAGAPGNPNGHAEDWWAFEPVTRPAVPVSAGDNWSRNPIDRFVLARLRAEGLTPAPRAEEAILVRRLYFDLIGLPPTPEELDAYFNNASADPWAALVDRLLADPRYGEHWARFWLDLVRYAESDGWNKDSYRPNAWRYRDYVVDAFNDDKPYPAFVREQIAGDEMPGDDPAQEIATGFLRLGIYEYNQRDARSHWNDIMNEITDVTGDVFFGLSMSCSRCHNHKFDPIPQTDYFSLRAFFEPLVWTDRATATDADRAAWQAQQENWEQATAGIRAEIDALCKPYYEKKWASTVDKFPLDIQACFNKPEAERDSWEQQMAYLVERQFYEEGTPALKTMSEEDKVTLEALEARLAEYDAVKPKPLPEAMVVRDFAGEAAPTRIPGRRDAPPVPPRFLTVFASDPASPPEIPKLPASTGRRTALAKWIGRDDNPLTTRLIVNRIWQQHFGQGIVASPSDFGHLGQRPTHPELLDWLTTDFVEHGWRMKRLHRQIVLSATWRQSAAHPEADMQLAKDPGETLLWRARARRLRAEEIRDAMLYVSGELDSSIGGPSVKSTVPRRGLYVISKRNAPDPLLYAFDGATGLTSVAQRLDTVTPTQSLLMINGDYTLLLARKLGGRMRRLEAQGADVALSYGFRLAWGRAPTATELERALAYVFPEDAEDKTKMDSNHLIDFSHVLLNANEFLHVQ